jgi:hypothetical protein
MIRKKMDNLGLSIIVIVCLFFCNGSFAQDIEIYPNLALDQNLSQQALTLAKQQFITLRQQLAAIAPSLLPDQQEAISQAIVVIDTTLAKLDRIEVYFASENSPGEAFETVYNFYKQRLSLQEVGSEELQYAVAQAAPLGLIPRKTLDSLMPLLEQNKVKAVVGGRGKSRMSLLTVYINPQTFQLIERTTVVIAIDK